MPIAADEAPDPAPIYSSFMGIEEMPPEEQLTYGDPRAPREVPSTVYPGPDGEASVQLPTFEIGLVLAGAVSAGAYTAGVLDYLVEALDAWEREKEQNARDFGSRFEKWTVPPHAVRLRVVAGASAGSVCGAILAVSSRYMFESGAALPRSVAPQSRQIPSPVPSPAGEPWFMPAHGNPFYNVWVRQLDIRPMLDTRDLTGGVALGKLQSLLNTAPLDHAARQICTLDLPPALPRRWVEHRVRLGVTVGNLTGIRHLYKLVGLEGGQFATTRHADILRFLVEGPKAGEEPLPANGDPALTIPWSQKPASESPWSPVADAALASAGFPVALRARTLNKPVRSYRFDLKQHGDIQQPPGTGWSQASKAVRGNISTLMNPLNMLPFVAVDGGTMNNQPFEYARATLAGPLGCNARDGKAANRAIILIDPFPAPEEPDPSVPAGSAAAGAPLPSQLEPENTGLLATLLRLPTAYINQARYDSNDLSVATDPAVYSRFILSPLRGKGTDTVTGAKAIASGALGAFGGFLHEALRHHDFLLGRRNAENFLRNYFALPHDNPLFHPGDGEAPNPWWTAELTGHPHAPKTGFWTMTGSWIEDVENGRAGRFEHERLIIPVMAARDRDPHVSAVADQHAPGEVADAADAELVRKLAVRRLLTEAPPEWPGSEALSTEILRSLDIPIQARARAILKMTFEAGRPEKGFFRLAWPLISAILVPLATRWLHVRALDFIGQGLACHDLAGPGSCKLCKTCTENEDDS